MLQKGKASALLPKYEIHMLRSSPSTIPSTFTSVARGFLTSITSSLNFTNNPFSICLGKLRLIFLFSEENRSTILG